MSHKPLNLDTENDALETAKTLMITIMSRVNNAELRIGAATAGMAYAQLLEAQMRLNEHPQPIVQRQPTLSPRRNEPV